MFSEHSLVFKDGSVRTIDCEYCRKLETTNWHYYKTKEGATVQLLKDAIAILHVKDMNTKAVNFCSCNSEVD